SIRVGFLAPDLVLVQIPEDAVAPVSEVLPPRTHGLPQELDQSAGEEHAGHHGPEPRAPAAHLAQRRVELLRDTDDPERRTGRIAPQRARVDDAGEPGGMGDRRQDGPWLDATGHILDEQAAGEDVARDALDAGLGLGRGPRALELLVAAEGVGAHAQ